MTVYIPSNQFGIAEGNYNTNQIVQLLRDFKNNPEAIEYIADMMEV